MRSKFQIVTDEESGEKMAILTLCGGAEGARVLFYPGWRTYLWCGSDREYYGNASGDATLRAFAKELLKWTKPRRRAKR